MIYQCPVKGCSETGVEGASCPAHGAALQEVAGSESLTEEDRLDEREREDDDG